MYPGSIPSYAGFTGSHTLSADNHASQSNAEQADIIAIATKIGTGASTPTSGMVLRGNGVGTSAWGQVILTSDVSGVLPQANGGTGTTLATGTGKAVYDTSPTIASPTLTTPTIADFTNATHDHSTNAKGGKITSTGITSLDLSLTTLSNPYKFSVYRNAAWTDGNNTFAKVSFDTKDWDTGSNYDATTNFRFTAPIAGFYQLEWRIGKTVVSGGLFSTALYKNGVDFKDGSAAVQGGATSSGCSVGSVLIQAAASDYFEIYSYGTGSAGQTGSNNNFFCGFLVSTS